MKKYYLFIALAMVAAMTVSCKNNNKKAKEAAEATAEVVEAAKTILADDVLATLDEFAEKYFNSDETGGTYVLDVICPNLTEEEKLVKPDYLLDPAVVNDLVTNSQKMAALSILSLERQIRIAYGMPVQESDEAIARLVADVNIPINNDTDKNFREKSVELYQKCKEQGELNKFWQFCFFGNRELDYIIVQNPDLYFRNITEEQYAALYDRLHACVDAVHELAKYDEEIALAVKVIDSNLGVPKEEERELFKTKEGARQQFIELKDNMIANRNNLLK